MSENMLQKLNAQISELINQLLFLVDIRDKIIIESNLINKNNSDLRNNFNRSMGDLEANLRILNLKIKGIEDENAENLKSQLEYAEKLDKINLKLKRNESSDSMIDDIIENLIEKGKDLEDPSFKILVEKELKSKMKKKLAKTEKESFLANSKFNFVNDLIIKFEEQIKLNDNFKNFNLEFLKKSRTSLNNEDKEKRKKLVNRLKEVLTMLKLENKKSDVIDSILKIIDKKFEELVESDDIEMRLLLNQIDKIK